MYKAASKIIALSFLTMISIVCRADLIDGEELIDPTRPLGFNASVSEDDNFLDRFTGLVPSSFAVSFIRAGSSNPIAVVNDQRVTIGDTIGGAEIVAIARSSVTLLINGEETEISLYANNVKTAVSN